MNSGGAPAGTGNGSARSRGASGAGLGDFGSAGRGGMVGREDLRGRHLRRRELRCRGSGAGVAGAGGDGEVGTVGRLRRAADGCRLTRSRGGRRASKDDERTAAACVAVVGSGTPEFALLPAGACGFTSSSVSSAASAVASAITAAAEAARGRRECLTGGQAVLRVGPQALLPAPCFARRLACDRRSCPR